MRPSEPGVNAESEYVNNVDDAERRICSLVETLRMPRTAEWIARQTNTDWEQTEAVLECLVAQGSVCRVTAGPETQYELPRSPGETHHRMGTLPVSRRTRERAREDLQRATAELEGFQEQFSADTSRCLERSLSKTDIPYGERCRSRDALAFWRATERDVARLTAALRS